MNRKESKPSMLEKARQKVSIESGIPDFILKKEHKMNRKESIEKAERELGRKKEIKRDDSFDRADYDAPIEVEAYTEGFNEMRDKAIPILADKIGRIKELEEAVNMQHKEKLKDMEIQKNLLISIASKKTKIAELQQKLDRAERALLIESSEPEERCQEASHYNWLDDKNKELQQKLNRVLGLDLTESFKWSVLEDGDIVSIRPDVINAIVKQKIQEVVGGEDE